MSAPMPDRPRGEEYVQRLMDEDRFSVPASLRAASFDDPGDVQVPPDCYTSRAYHDLEVARLWRRVWQMACREEDIADVGDHVVYDVADLSLIVARTGPGRIQAFHNSCLHRGTQLRSGPGRSTEWRCSFHGFTWRLDGSFKEMPCPWDFPQVDPATFCLPEAKVGVWGGFVFVNPDPDASPLAQYLEILPSHFRAWPLEDRWKRAHVVRTVPCNWKVALEAFIESYHTVAVHPQLLRTTGDTLTEYDVYADSRHVSRMITPIAMASEHVGRVVGDDEVLQAMFSTRDNPTGGKAREVIADRMRETFPGVSMSDSEAVDAIEYFLFPNFMPWPSYTTPLVYRFRPNGNDPDSSVMDIMLLEPVPASGRPSPSPTRVLEPGETWADAPELGYLGRIINQDYATLGRIQRGLKASVRPSLTLAHYQEARIRHFHATLALYVGA